MKTDINEKIVIPQTVSVNFSENRLTIKGPKGEDQRDFIHPKINIIVESSEILLKSSGASKREKRMISTFIAHIKNMLRGVQIPFEYKLKICSGHFPMNVSLQGEKFIVKNFLGEKHPRILKIHNEAKVKIDGTEIQVSSASREVAGMVSAKIEQLCRITNKDRRIFQDGIYIIKKPSRIEEN